MGRFIGSRWQPDYPGEAAPQRQGSKVTGGGGLAPSPLGASAPTQMYDTRRGAQPMGSSGGFVPTEGPGAPGAPVDPTASPGPAPVPAPGPATGGAPAQKRTSAQSEQFKNQWM